MYFILYGYINNEIFFFFPQGERVESKSLSSVFPTVLFLIFPREGTSEQLLSIEKNYLILLSPEVPSNARVRNSFPFSCLNSNNLRSVAVLGHCFITWGRALYKICLIWQLGSIRTVFKFLLRIFSINRRDSFGFS